MLQTKEDCWFSERRCRDQTEDVYPLHWVMATGKVCMMSTRNSRPLLSFVYSLYWPRLGWKQELLLILDFACVCLCACLCSQAMSILLLPHNIPDSLKHLSTLVDDIWYYAGDRSTDVSGSYHPRSPSSATDHTFLSPLHHHPHNIRPATSQVTPPTNTWLCPC